MTVILTSSFIFSSMHGAEDDVGVFVRGALDDGGSLVDLGEAQRTGAGDVDEDAASAVDGSGFEQRRRDGCLRSGSSAVLAASGGGSHDRVAHAGHDGLHVGEVAVDDAGDGDDVGDALHRLAKNVVGNAERFEEAGVFGDREQLFVGDDDGGVDGVDELLQAAVGLGSGGACLRRRTAW